MNEVIMLKGAEPREILQTIIEKRISAIMSYLSNGKWHAVKVYLTHLGANRFTVEIIQEDKNHHPINIRPDQPVGMSLKYGYGKFVFDTQVLSLEPSADPKSGGRIILSIPDRIEIVQRRNYFRVDVPKSLKVKVVVWHRHHKSEHMHKPPENYWQGKLVDISAGGLQVAIDKELTPDFRNKQFVGIRFTPLPYEQPLMFNAQIRNIVPSADETNICLGMQIVGLEASPEGRHVLQRLCGVVERYHQINQSSAKQEDMKAIG